MISANQSVEVYKDQAVDLIYAGIVRGSVWIPFYAVPSGNAIELTELLVYNNAAGSINFALWIGPSTVTPGAGLAQAYIPFLRTLTTGVSGDWPLRTGVPGGWSIYGYSDAGPAEVLNFHLSGRQVSF